MILDIKIEKDVKSISLGLGIDFEKEVTIVVGFIYWCLIIKKVKSTNNIEVIDAKILENGSK